MNFKFKISPLKHQTRYYKKAKDKPIYALFWEQGTGKTKAMVDQSAYLYQEELIDGLFVIAPNDVHKAWVNEQIPEHMTEDVKYLSHFWDGMGTKKSKQTFNRLLEFKGLAVFTMNYEATITKKGQEALRRFLEARTILFVLDESHRIKSHKAKRTTHILLSGKGIPFKRVLSGTPIGKFPFDLYTQLGFLSFKILDFVNYYAFINYFGKFIKVELDQDNDLKFLEEQLENATNPKQKSVLNVKIREQKRLWQKKVRNREVRKPFRKLVSFMNLDELTEKIQPYSDRVLKKEVFDLPKSYQTRLFILSKETRAIYEDMKERFIVELEDGKFFTVKEAMVRIGKLQQIACGFLYGEQREIIYRDESFLRQKKFMDIIEDYYDQSLIVWCKYDYDIDTLKTFLDNKYEYVQFDGRVKSKQRTKNLEAFQKGDAQIFLSKVKSGGTGLNLQVSSTSIFFSNDWSYIDRDQAESRPHRQGQKASCVNYIDIMAEDTVDQRLKERLKTAFDISNDVIDGGLREWLY